MDEEKSLESKLEQKPDLSQKTVVVLVVLTVLISVLGTVAVLNEVGSIQGTKIPTVAQAAQPAGAQVKFEIRNPPQPMTDSASGKVSLTILPNNKQKT